MGTILVVDDNPAVAEALELLFSLSGWRTVVAGSPAEALAMLENERVDLVVQDMNFSGDTTSGEEGVALFRTIRARDPDLAVILLTAWTDLPTAVELVRGGAADYLAKPWDDQKLLATARNLLELSQSRRELARHQARSARARSELELGWNLCGLVFASSAMEGVVSLACRVARAEVPVLITGPNGVGKEKIAEIVQANSAVKDGPFVQLNCGAIPGELVEAELFGAEAGAYTGASRAREGKFEAAHGGTLFLDEIGTLPPAGQIKLLRVLETGRFERLGSNRETKVRVRVISATNADLRTMIAEGRFREDLYYRLNLIEIEVPPLSERPEDILPLAEHFLAGRARLGTAATAALLAHDWPGNVRELRNCLERAALLSSTEELEPAALGLPQGVGSHAPPAEPDREAIEAALERAGGVLSQAAGSLGLSRQALYRRLERLGIPR
jgi:DNA-binding NtrC family response regulator